MNVASEVLGVRELNRALLARQSLLERSAASALEMIERLVGLQAQAPWPPYYGLWSRLAGFHQDELVHLLTDRRVVRIGLMRGTVHLVSAADCLTLRPLTQPILDRALRSNFRGSLDGLELPALFTAGRALVEARPHTMSELGARLAEDPRWTEWAPAALAQAVRAGVPLVQVPPRGIWGVGGQTRVTSAEAWLGRPLHSEPSIEDVVLRYLAAFGPATVKDVQTWMGVTRLKPVLDRLRSRLAVFRDDQGKELFDLPDAPRPGPETEAPVRFVAEFDNILLSHADRRRIMSEEARKRTLGVPNGVFPGTFLVDGFVAGTWRIERTSKAAALHLTPYEPLDATTRDALAAEGSRLLTFAAGETADHDIRFVLAEQ
ncbi:winged helix DNA-binding domain-containing protein [Actinoallomurus sp. NBC_01490]|uniref:winged helix DNA-binding domain-containing protein n=1 Tax=Actinoallomurus sp. NBC_01490 TaxID=2903557 RepID=UPI002E32A7F6|nr:winged helix DNA-binding domain-containing protein [Actinoallomurus sp. NBC_01490]